jgi:hypothetical protein
MLSLICKQYEHVPVDGDLRTCRRSDDEIVNVSVIPDSFTVFCCDASANTTSICKFFEFVIISSIRSVACTYVVRDANT